ncbi:MAG: metalloregulator ArsR/SmtB family transcription factor [Oscillatoria sp. PMC 1051.18]|uniref:ArsR/SmtB family transcription factor n=1 Tax=Oscillatoria salina TaxID=331517 RepID=UPI0013B9F5B5|nr:metalloregulator ArsR/SmtB family transcription factor [Oscillatoria salina]MBZ8178588.1 helix-turn-helix transcriptional regulator [Oscillatoria salina IIICB1]MEC4895004.1 metalloregulator ArsR/SmtB family transcription factor [Oscillatoria sp. PMC 1050.18]MEC5029934.1 metalloregulator ArsR/SmtB family transcription factor [Oscillatoria sp. PMC 1051.18]NET87337.1 helix-turn-helix transcriptional regulator [Kamptonema sp. SIO1D9]
MQKSLSPKTTPEALAPIAEYFKVLSEVSRLQILSCLRSGAMNVTELGDATGLGQANLSKHLKMLTQAGLLSRQPQGVSVYYEISDPVIFELCELVCDRVGDRIQQQAAKFERFI